MRILLDTHCWLWLQTEPERLSSEAMELAAEEANELLLSAASSWEIAIKYGLGRLSLPSPPHEYVPGRMQVSGTAPLAVEHAHALHVARLPRHHTDPFDRLLVAQAMVEGVAIMTNDRRLEPYDVSVVWAG